MAGKVCARPSTLAGHTMELQVENSQSIAIENMKIHLNVPGRYYKFVAANDDF